MPRMAGAARFSTLCDAEPKEYQRGHMIAAWYSLDDPLAVSSENATKVSSKRSWNRSMLSQSVVSSCLP